MVLERYFRKAEQEAQLIMLAVHHKGRGVAGVYTRDVAETKVAQVTAHARPGGLSAAAWWPNRRQRNDRRSSAGNNWPRRRLRAGGRTRIRDAGTPAAGPDARPRRPRGAAGPGRGRGPSARRRLQGNWILWKSVEDAEPDFTLGVHRVVQGAVLQLHASGKGKEARRWSAGAGGTAGGGRLARPRRAGSSGHVRGWTCWATCRTARPRWTGRSRERLTAGIDGPAETADGRRRSRRSRWRPIPRT